MDQWWNKKFINRRDYILDSFEDLTINSEECLLILLIDFMNQFQIPISHSILASKMKKELHEIDDLLTNLTQKGYVSIQYQDRKIMFTIDGIFESPKQKNIDFDQNLFDMYESEFSRPLTQVEMQRLSDWSKIYDQKLILYALREAIIYDKRNFDYINRILLEWKKRDFTVQDYEEGNR